jgi:hypothetical protein
VRRAGDQHVLRHPDSNVLAGSPTATFSCLYAEHEARIDVRTLDVVEGQLPRRALALVLEWAPEHRAELMGSWELCQFARPSDGAMFDADRGKQFWISEVREWKLA